MTVAFGDNRAWDVLHRAGDYREGVQLDADEVADLVEAMPDPEEFVAYDEVAQRLGKVDVKALRISVRARRELPRRSGTSPRTSGRDVLMSA